MNPMTPTEVLEKSTMIPSEVFSIVNELLVDRMNPSKEIVLMLEELVKLIKERMNINRTEIFNKHMMDFEEDYNKIGWKCEFHKPERDESFESFFRFNIV